MPVYEYRCTECEHQFELWQEVGAEAPVCEKCGATVKKVFHPVRTIYKGSGFYITDTRSEKSKSSSNGGSNGSTGTATESKTESKSESSAPSSSESSSAASSNAAKSESK